MTKERLAYVEARVEEIDAIVEQHILNGEDIPDALIEELCGYIEEATEGLRLRVIKL